MVEPIEKVFADIASITPTQLATERASTRVRAALQIRRRHRWLLPTSLAAAIVLFAALFPFLLQKRASAAERLAQAISTTQAYQGWITMTYDDAVYHVNTKTNASVYQHKDHGKISIFYKNPATREFAEYDSATNLIRLSTLSPNWLETLSQQAAANPASYSDFLQHLKQTLDVNIANIAAKSESGLDRYEIGTAISAATQPHHLYTPELPTTVWVDPHTGLIAKTLREGSITTFTYGESAILSIYDAGAPRTAKILDIRPTKEAIAVVDRIRKLQNTPLPDGVCAWYRESYTTRNPEKHADLLVYAKTGSHWIQRIYRVRLAGDTDAAHLEVPDNWASNDADELFRRMPQASPDSERSGDDKSAAIRDFLHHEEIHFLNPVAQNVADVCLPTYRLYPLWDDYGVDCRLDLITSPDRPGQLGLKFQVLDAHDEDDEEEFWIDPSHNDRPIMVIAIEHDALHSAKISYKQITEISNYNTLPPPDNRSYPISWTWTQYEPDKDGKLIPASYQTATFHFFPGRTLPELFKNSK